MRKIITLSIIGLVMVPNVTFAETDAEIALNQAISIVKTNCSGISARMENIKKMVGIGTAVNAIGTVAGAGGVASGIVKYKADINTLDSLKEKTDIDELIRQAKAAENSQVNQELLARVKTLDPNLRENLEKLTGANRATSTQGLEDRSAQLQSDIAASEAKSNRMGNIRTGLFATDTVTNVAGAIVSSKTVADGDFIEQINKCKESVTALQNARLRVKVEDGENANPQKMDLSQKMIDKCSQYEYANFQQLNNLGKGAMISNSVGAATGAAATITSALGNKKYSDMASGVDITNQESVDSVNKKMLANQKINIASNALGGVTAAASLAGTVLNASQIKTAKQILTIAQECEEAIQ